MIATNRRTKVFVYKKPADMRASYDSLTFLVQDVLKEDPFSGHLFLFINARRNSLKCLYYDGTGMVIVSKRLEGGMSYSKINPFYKNQITMSSAEFGLYFEGADLNKRFIESPAIKNKKIKKN